MGQFETKELEVTACPVVGRDVNKRNEDETRYVPGAASLTLSLK